MAPASYKEFEGYEQKAGTSFYFMKTGETVDATLDGFEIDDTVFTPANGRMAITPDGRQIVVPTAHKKAHPARR